MNVGIYPRVSTQEQALNGHSIDEQIDRCRKYCEAMGWTVYRIYTDAGQSGASLNRPGLQQMIRDIKSGRLDKVLVYKLDRLSRSQKDTLYLIEDVFLANKIDFVSMSENFDTSTAFGRAMIGILSVFAQLEREQIRERMIMGKDARAKEGLYSGCRYSPTGYDYVDGELVVNEYEAMLVRRIFDRVEALESLCSIAREMNAAGLRPRSGQWTPQLIRRMVRSQNYIGNISYDGKWFPGKHQAIIDPAQFEAVQNIMDTRRDQYQEFNRRLGRSNSLLGGFLVCAWCGAKYAKCTKRHKNKNGTTYFREYYSCNSRAGRDSNRIRDPNCKNENWNVSDLNDLVFGEIKKLALDPEYLPSLQSTADETEQENAEVIRNEIRKIEDQISRLLDLYTVGSVPVDVVQQRISDLGDRRSALEESLSEAEAKKERPTPQDTLDTIRSFDDVLSRGDFDEIRSVLASLISFIEIDGQTVTIHWNFL